MDHLNTIDTFNRFIRVSRETIKSLIRFEKLLIIENKKLNLIGKSTIQDIWNRHFLDSAQVFDFITKNDKVIVDLGAGAGFPGLILAIVAKDRKMSLKIKIIEKSSKTIKFLKKIISEFKLNAEVENKNVFDNEFKFTNEVFVARAFKPIKIILELMHSKAANFKKIFIFLGKTGKSELLEASKSWNIEYKQRVCITSSDSMIIEINYLEKK